jgi:hypothetical protein
VQQRAVLHGVFDSVDLYGNESLSVGALCGGLSNFFMGDANEHACAIFDMLVWRSSHRSEGSQFTQEVLRSFLQPFVWCMVPTGANVLRPILLEHVADELFCDIASGHGESIPDAINELEFRCWVERIATHKDNRVSGKLVRSSVDVSSGIIDQIAQVMDRVMQSMRCQQSLDSELNMKASLQQACAKKGDIGKSPKRLTIGLRDRPKECPQTSPEKVRQSSRINEHLVPVGTVTKDWGSKKIVRNR